MKVLLVRPWVHPLAPLRDALRTAGFDPRFTRVDIEPALNAALARGAHDVILLDPNTPSLSRAIVEARLRDHRVDIAIVELDGDLRALCDRIRVALASRRH
jgi:hypothetical protein